MKALFRNEKLIEERIGRLKETTDPEELKFRKINLLASLARQTMPKYYPLINEYFNDADADIRNRHWSPRGIPLNLNLFLRCSIFPEKKGNQGYRSTLALANYRECNN